MLKPSVYGVFRYLLQNKILYVSQFKSGCRLSYKSPETLILSTFRKQYIMLNEKIYFNQVNAFAGSQILYEITVEL